MIQNKAKKIMDEIEDLEEEDEINDENVPVSSRLTSVKCPNCGIYFLDKLPQCIEPWQKVMKICYLCEKNHG